MKLKQLLFLTYIFILPVDGTDYLSFHVGFIHASVLDLLLVLMLYLVFLEGAIGGFQVSPFVKKICLLLVFSCVVSFISLTYIPSEYISFDIKITLNILEFSALIFVASQVINDYVFLRKVLAVLCVSVFIVSAVGVLKSLGFNLPGTVRGEARHYVGPFFIGITGITNVGLAYSALALAAFPFVLRPAVLKSSLVRVLIISVIMLASAVAFSRNLWISLGVQILAFMFFFQMFHESMMKRILVLMSLVGSILLLLIYWHNMYMSLVGLRPVTVGQRIEGYLRGFEMATSSIGSFLFGVGESFFLSTLYENIVLPHNVLLEILIAKGLITLLLIIAVFYIILMELFREMRLARNRGLFEQKEFATLSIITLFGFFSFGMVAPLFNSMVFWTMVAIVCSFVVISLDKDSSALAVGEV